VMLYDGALRNLNLAISCIESKDIEGKRVSVNRALAIVQHLQGTLDLERGGELAAGLNRIYDYVVTKILEGSMQLKASPLQEAVKLLKNLLSSWEEVARQKQRQPHSGLSKVMVG